MADAETITHGNLVYRIIPLDTTLAVAEELRTSGKKWHSHVLSPGCLHNPKPEQYGLVIEDDSEDITYLAHSVGFPEEDKVLVKILHGDDILDASKSGGDSAAVAASTLLPKVREIDASGAAWHHHMHFPTCSFNPHRGKWAISVEDGKGGVFSETYDEEPVDVLREIEVIYFRHLDAKTKDG